VPQNERKREKLKELFTNAIDNNNINIFPTYLSPKTMVRFSFADFIAASKISTAGTLTCRPYWSNGSKTTEPLTTAASNEKGSLNGAGLASNFTVSSG